MAADATRTSTGRPSTSAGRAARRVGSDASRAIVTTMAGVSVIHPSASR
ncbi:hypothetical protein [Leifsonia sp. PS1209]|nr:hypothetical protein [Leifsonia sp. PS1209]QIZ99754.1 hypothetical protein HF024_15380 [Leifsonia sp. PS1209]